MADKLMAMTILNKKLVERLGNGFLSLYTLLFCIFLLAPICVVVAVSFTPNESLNLPYQGFSLRWYKRVIDYQPFMTSMLTSLVVALLSALIAVVFAVPAALALTRMKGRVANGCSAFLLSPLAIPPLVIGLSLLYYLSKLGIGVSFMALIIAHTVVSVPYVMRTVLAVYRNVASNYAEASLVLGANQWRTFRYITLPLIAPGIFAGALFAILVSLDNLGLSFFFGTANVTTLPVVMLSYLQNQFDPAIAAISTIQMLLTLILLLIVERTYGLRTLTTQ